MYRPSEITRAFHDTAKLGRREIFADTDIKPITAIQDAETPAPGWVGPDWAGGTLLVAINPGGGGDKYRRNSDDDRLYSTFRTFRDADGADAQADAFRSLSQTWMEAQRGHNIWRIIRPIAEATGESIDQLAFINVLPFRTRENKLPSRKVMQETWRLAAKPQILALDPARIIALGKKAWDVLTRFDVPESTEVILFKRGIGDSCIPEESKAVLARLTAARDGRT